MRPGVIVLNEALRNPGTHVTPLLIRFQKESALVAVDFGFNDKYVREGCCGNLHACPDPLDS